jgi:predicted nucleotide-binding protein
MLRGETDVIVSSDSRASIESIFSIFEEAPQQDKVSTASTKAKRAITIFIGHGRNNEWSKLSSHLQDKHKVNVISYETGARAGHTIRDILDSMAEEASLALLVLTGEDKTQTGMRARQNVIHECGLFQGRLGFDRAVMVVEKGIELASNFDGIQQLRFRKGHISEIFGDVIATIRREFGPI